MTLPKGWVIKSLAEVAQLTMGQSPESKYYSTEEVGLPFLQGCAEFRGRHPEHLVYCSHSKKIGHAGSILLSVRAPVGRLNVADRDYVIGRGLAALNGAQVTQEFLEHVLASEELRFRLASQGSTFEAITSSELRQWPILHPVDKSEQSKIAEVLSTVDRAIEQTAALIAKQQRIKTGLMQDLLSRGIDEYGNFRCEKTHKFKDSALGRIPETWAVGTLLDATERTRQPILTGPFGADLGDSDFVEEGVPVLRIGNVQRGRLELSDLLFVSAEKARKLSRYVIRTGDLLFARQGATTGRNALADERADGWLINYHIIRVALDHELCAPRFIEASFDSESVKQQIDREKGRGTREGINTAQLKALRLKLPSVPEQRAIAFVLGAHDIQRAHTRQLKLKLLRLRAGLMQDLLTGRRRVTALLGLHKAATG